MQKKTRDSIDCSQKRTIDKLILKIIPPVADSAKRTISDQKTRVSSDRALSERSVPCRKTKPEMTLYSSPDCKPACPERADLKIDILRCPKMKDPLSQITRKNSLDSFEVSSLKKPLSKYKRRICSASYQPVRPATKDVSSDFFHTKKSSSDIKFSPIETCMQKCLDDQRFQRLSSEQRTEVTRLESAKSDKVSPCQKSAVAFRPADLIPEKVSEKTLHLPSSPDLLARYKKYIPAYQLERYESCRSKRNGLQDECIPPLLRAILKEEEQRRTLDKCIERGENIDQLDQSESTNQDQTIKRSKILLFVE